MNKEVRLFIGRQDIGTQRKVSIDRKKKAQGRGMLTHVATYLVHLVCTKVQSIQSPFEGIYVCLVQERVILLHLKLRQDDGELSI